MAGSQNLASGATNACPAAVAMLNLRPVKAARRLPAPKLDLPNYAA